MIAMQYRFLLPADYDMGVIDRRIADKGPLLDRFPGLAFKAYLSARKGEPGPENLYAPFYVWRTTEGLDAFVSGAGFAAVSGAFGWPSVRTWVCWRALQAPDIAMAAHASLETAEIRPHAALAELRERECAEAQRDLDDGALAAVAAFEPTRWTRIRFRLWREAPKADGEIYRVGHVSLGAP